MMAAFKPVGALLKKDGERPLLDEVDVKHFIERYLKKELAANTLYCESVEGGRAQVRVGSPILQQEVCLLEHDIKQALAQELDYSLKSVKVIQS